MDYIQFDEKGEGKSIKARPFLRSAFEQTQKKVEKELRSWTLEWQIRILRVRIMDLMLLVGGPMWKFIKRHPRLYWLWNKSQPLIKVICWFFPLDLEFRNK